MKNKLMQLSWALGIVFAGLLYIFLGGSDLLKQQVQVLAWKLVLSGTAVGLAHVIRKQLFGYIDLSEMLKEKTQASAIVFLGIAVIYAAIILSICSGL